MALLPAWFVCFSLLFYIVRFTYLLIYSLLGFCSYRLALFTRSFLLPCPTMKFFLSTFYLALAITNIVIAAPTTLESRQVCGKWDTINLDSASDSSSSYVVVNNLWNASSADSGYQCTTVDSYSGDTMAWTTSWTWTGGSNQVKSYASVEYVFPSAKLHDISSINTVWSWRYCLCSSFLSFFFSPFRFLLMALLLEENAQK
jgi:hypothetical protein